MSDRLTVRAKIENNFPRFAEEDQLAMSAWYADKNDKYVNVTLSVKRPVRSKEQNSYLWAVVYEMIANETGANTEEIHEAMKEELLPKQFVTIEEKEYPVPKSTTRLTTVEFEEYAMKVREYAGRVLGINIPLPNET